MITLRRSSERHHARWARRQGWSSFEGRPNADGFAFGFGVLERFDEHRLEAKASLLVQPAQGFEVISYVVTGVVASRHSPGQTSILRAGDFQRVSGGQPGGLRQTNPSSRNDARLLQLWLRRGAPHPTRPPEQRRFSGAQRRGALCLIAGGDAREAALQLREDVLIFSAVLDPGQHIVHELSPRRSAWLHVVQGEITSNDSTLVAGDAASFALERSVSLTARSPSEVLIVDLAHLASAAPI